MRGEGALQCVPAIRAGSPLLLASQACTDPAVRAAEDSAKREVVELSQQHWRGGDKLEENARGFGGRESAMLPVVSYP